MKTDFRIFEHDKCDIESKMKDVICIYLNFLITISMGDTHLYIRTTRIGWNCTKAHSLPSISKHRQQRGRAIAYKHDGLIKVELQVSLMF